jgi:acyl-CoA thioesterase-1
MNAMARRRLVPSVFALVLLSACSFRNVACSTDPPAPIEPVSLTEAPSGAAGETPVVGIAFLGDSITAGLGLLSDEAYPALIEQMFFNEGYEEVEVLNAGLSGDTTAGGLRRVDQVLQPGVRVLVVALGGNDALRGLTAIQTHDNLAAIIEAALSRDVAVVLAGMQAPTNLGPDYQTAFRDAYQRLATEYAGAITFVPFLLEGVAGDPALNLPDGIHPNQDGQAVIAGLLYPGLRDIADQLVFSGRD